MMGKLWVVLFVGLASAQIALALPLRSPPPIYPHDAASPPALPGSTLYIFVAVCFTVAAAGVLLGCGWCGWLKGCFKHKDHKLFSSSVVTLQVERSAPTESLAEPANNNISEDNNNGPISLREMQNIANNNATIYITSENEERNRISRESVVEFEPLPREIGVVDPLERCADWFAGDDLPRNRLQYLREIGRGWFGRVVEGEIDEEGSTSTVAVKILNQNASLEDKARFLDENRLYKDVRHENILKFVAKYLQEDPWLLLFELCSMDLSEWLDSNRDKMAIHNERAVPLQLMCDVTSGLSYLHSRGCLYGNVTSTNVLIREHEGSIQAVVGNYTSSQVPQDLAAPESRRHPAQYTTSSEVWSIGTLLWEVCAWGSSIDRHPPPPPPLPHPYSAHLYQVMQLCWELNPDSRPTSAQVHALISHLRAHALSAQGQGGSSEDFEARWQRLKPNTIPKLDEHIAIIHAPSTSQTSPLPADSLSVDFGLSRSSSIISDQMSTQIKSDSLNNLHGSLEDVRNIYLTHNETAAIECNQGNIAFDDKEDRSDSLVDPWLKDIMAGSQDDVSYYKDVSDVIKNLDNILNSEKTSSSESSHQASPSRDNLSLDCKKEAPAQSSLVKSPGISNFQNILEAALEDDLPCDEDDKDTEGTLSHSFERHSDTTSQHTLENLTPDTPVKDPDFNIVSPSDKTGLSVSEDHSINGTVKTSEKSSPDYQINGTVIASDIKASTEITDPNIPKDEKRSAKLPNLRELIVTSLTSVSENEQLNVREASCDNLDEVRTEVETKSIDKLNQNVESKGIDSTKVSKIVQSETNHNQMNEKVNGTEKLIPVTVAEIANVFVENELIKPAIDTVQKMHQNKPNHVRETNEIKITTLVGSMSTTAQVHKEKKEILHHDLIPFPTVEKEPKPISEEVIPKKEFKLEMPSIISDHTDFEAFETVKSDAEDKLQKEIVDSTIDEVRLEENVRKFLEDSKSSPTATPEPVQSLSDDITEVTNETEKLETASVSEDSQLPTEVTDNLQTSTEPETYPIGDKVEDIEVVNVEDMRTITSDESTIYMDLINDTNKIKDSAVDNFKEILEQTAVHNDAWKNESTVYLDLPSILKDTNAFLQSERVVSNDVPTIDIICASTPKGSDESSIQDSKDNCDISETEIPERRATLTLEQRIVPETPSPFESPTKSHPTDTYEDNSSVLGPFETQESMEHKSLQDVDIPKEELLAFSSNFSEINLATPSPLRDGNFLKEVPDIVSDTHEIEKTESQDLKSDNSTPSGTTKHISPSTPPNSPGIFLASSQKYVVDIDIEPSTSRGTDSGLSSWQKEFDINHIEMQIHSKLAMAENENNMNIEYSGPLTVEGIVSEDEVNNIVDFSRPLTVEGIVSEEEGVLRDNDAIPEAVLAGNGGSVEDLRVFSLDEESVKALRNELELKLPLAQVASIEPANDPEDHSWSELPPPPELIVCYAGGALSPIAEETGHQLINYENDCNISTRTDSSESYLEPCNNSTDEVTDLPTATQPTGLNSTYSLHSASGNDDQSPNDTYTVHKDVASSKEVTMTPDSLNCSPHRQPTKQAPSLSPIDDQTYNKNDEQAYEHISQVSPFLISPTTDSTGNSPDNPTAVSTLSKTTVTTDVKPHEDLSKANSIDSWCSNDTLYNVEENFDDLAVDDAKDESEDTDTLHNDKESHCSTYIIHESDSECDSFSADSITDKDDYTYTKMKTEPTATANTSVNENKLERNTNNQAIEAFGIPNKLEKNTNNQAIDAFGMPNKLEKNTNNQAIDAFGMPNKLEKITNNQAIEAFETPSYSKFTTEVMSSMNDPWLLPEPEMIRRSPVVDIEFNDTQLKITANEEQRSEIDPNITRPSMKKMDSVEITHLGDTTENYPHNTECVETVNNEFHCDFTQMNRLVAVENALENNQNNTEIVETVQNSNFRRKMTPSLTSTPIVDPADDSNEEVIPMVLPHEDSPCSLNIPNFQAFIQSAEIRPQDISTNSNELTNIATCTDTGLLLEGDSKTLSKINRDSTNVSDRTPNFAEFESSAALKPQELTDRTPNFTEFESSAILKPQELNSGFSQNFTVSSGEFRHFENSVRGRPQDLTSLDASSLLLNSERRISERVLSVQTSQSANFQSPLNISPPITNLVESQPLVFNNETFVAFVSDLDVDETDQPHSIIITDVSNDIPFSAKSPVITTSTEHSGENVPFSLKSPIINTNNLGGDIPFGLESPVVNTNTDQTREDDPLSAKAPVINTNSVGGDIPFGLESPVINTNTDHAGEDIPLSAKSPVINTNSVGEDIPFSAKSPVINTNNLEGDTPFGLESPVVNTNTNHSGEDVPFSAKSPITNTNSLGGDTPFSARFPVINTNTDHSGKDVPFSAKSPIINTNNLGGDIPFGLESPVITTNTDHTGGDIPYSARSPVINTNTHSPGEANKSYDSQTEGKATQNETFNSHAGNISPRENNETNLETKSVESEEIRENVFYDFGNTDNSVEYINNGGLNNDNQDTDNLNLNKNKNNTESTETKKKYNEAITTNVKENNGTVKTDSNENQTSIPTIDVTPELKVNGTAENYATVSFINETFEELDNNHVQKNEEKLDSPPNCDIKMPETTENINGIPDHSKTNGTMDAEIKMAAVTKDFLQNEKRFTQVDAYLPLLSDIRFSGPTCELMSTSFTESPTSPECEQDGKHNSVSELVKEWDSDTESQSSNDSSGEFIWKDGDGHETAVVPRDCVDHQRSNNEGQNTDKQGGSAAGSGDSGSGSEGDEVEFVPSSWDCRAEPSKSSLRSLQNTPESKKRVVFKRQKYHCVYEYPREVATVDVHSPAFAPDYSTYCEWDPSSAEDAELGYGQLFGAPSALDMYPLRGIFSSDYDDDFFISSSARPFEALGVMSTTSQFFPGMHSKAHLSRDISEDIDDLPAPPSPLTTQITMRTPSLDFTTPDSGVEDITPGSAVDEDFKTKKLPEDVPWKPIDSTSSSESVSPSSPGGEALGGLRHTRDKLKLDLPPSPHIPSPRLNRVFNFILDKPKRHRQEDSTPLVMTDETPIINSLPLDEDIPMNTEPTFSTFGKNNHSTTDNGTVDDGNKIVFDDIEDKKAKDVVSVLDEIDDEKVKEIVSSFGKKYPTTTDGENKIILGEINDEKVNETVSTYGKVNHNTPDGGNKIVLDEIEDEKVNDEDESSVKETVKGEGTVLDSGDEDSGIESSSKASLERKANV